MSQLRQQGVEIVTGDVRELETVRAFVAGAQGAALIHMAAVIHPKTVAQFEAINTQGTSAYSRAKSRCAARDCHVVEFADRQQPSSGPPTRGGKPDKPTHGLRPRRDADGKGGASGNRRQQTCRNVHRSSVRHGFTIQPTVKATCRNRRSMPYTANLAHGNLLAVAYKMRERGFLACAPDAVHRERNHRDRRDGPKIRHHDQLQSRALRPKSQRRSKRAVSISASSQNEQCPFQ